MTPKPDEQPAGVESKPEPDFHCGVCGVEVDIAPDPPEKAVCPACCPDHHYIYIPDQPSKCCEYCGQPIPEDWR